MSSPYRGESDSLRAELRASLQRITPTLEMLLPEALRARVVEARAIVEAAVPLAAHLEAAREAIAMAPEIERRLDELPSALPLLPDASGEPVDETLLRLCLPARVSDVQIGRNRRRRDLSLRWSPVRSPSFRVRVIDARRPHERAIALLAALREVRGPVLELLR